MPTSLDLRNGSVVEYVSRSCRIDILQGLSTYSCLACGLASIFSQASDIWSLGCILYQMVYGQTPFASLHLIQKLQAIIDPDHQIIFSPTVEDAVIDAMKKCLQRRPEDRPPIIGKNGLLDEHPFLNSNRSI